MSFFVQLLLLNQTDGKNIVLPDIKNSACRKTISCGRRYFFRFADCLNMIYHCHRLLKAYAVCPLSHANDVS